MMTQRQFKKTITNTTTTMMTQRQFKKPLLTQLLIPETINDSSVIDNKGAGSMHHLFQLKLTNSKEAHD
jgi:hypothetical protein